MPKKKIDPRSPDLAVWTAVVVALVHRSSLAITPKTPNDRRAELATFGAIADEVLDMYRARCDGDEEGGGDASA